MTDLFDDILTPAIYEFKGEYAFLSNFHPAEFVWSSRLWKTTEHAYQAMKSLDIDIQTKIQQLPTPGAAKRAGKLIELRPDWEQVKIDLMREIVLYKFVQNPELKQKLIDTGDAHLEEGNKWRDQFWGVCPPRSGKGRNELGKALMVVREVIRDY